MIDLRSDTVTRPTPAMRQAMANAEVGDDVWGDDPTVNRLQAMVAEMLGKDDALFTPSGTQSNLCALFAHCQRGDEYLVGANAHMYRYEAGGGAVVASVQPQPIPMNDDGSIDLDQAAAAVKPDDPHFARSRLLCIENTHDGKVLGLDFQSRAASVAQDHNLGLHLDGARMANAAVALGVELDRVAAPFDTISMCLSKGLGAPVGSVLVGSADLIAGARRARKILGGAMRQAGVLAAAGIHALENNVERLADDHARASKLAVGLAELGFAVENNTNMVFVTFGPHRDGIVEMFTAEGILAAIAPDTTPDRPSRLVTHLDITDADIETTLRAVTKALELSR